MKILNHEQNSPEWFEDRLGKITSSKLDKLVVKRGEGRKLAFYEILAERLGVVSDETDARERGRDYEEKAIEAFEEMTGMITEKAGLCVSDANEYIALSPDRLIKIDGKYTRAVEVKCLSTARHLMVWDTQKVPSEYWLQGIQYFIVNDDLEILYFAFYDDRLDQLPLFLIEVRRADVEADITKYRAYQNTTIAEMDTLINKLSF